MNRLYQSTFDHVRMPEDRARSLRAVLASHCSDPETEVISMNKQKALRRPATFLVAALLIVALSITALACGGQVIYQIISSGNSEVDIPTNGITQDLTEQGDDAASYSYGPYEYTEKNGQVQVTFDDSDWDDVD